MDAVSVVLKEGRVFVTTGPFCVFAARADSGQHGLGRGRSPELDAVSVVLKGGGGEDRWRANGPGDVRGWQARWLVQSPSGGRVRRRLGEGWSGE